jgi:hypothetical protein
MRYMDRQVTIIYTANDVNIFYEGQRIAYHKRNQRQHRYTTIPDHLPSSHRYMTGLKPEYFIQWGKEMGDEVSLYLEKLFASKRHPEQAYKSCQGIQSLTRKLGKDKLLAACKTGLELEIYNYMFIKNVMENHQDCLSSPMGTLPFHENIRGPQAYQ